MSRPSIAAPTKATPKPNAIWRSICLHNGEGVARDQLTGAHWFKKAAEGGDAWAQTQYAIQLRLSKLPENERESVEWLLISMMAARKWVRWSYTSF
jgi:TPR repeat protein